CSFQQTFFDTYNTTVSRYHLNGLLLAGAPGSGKTFMTLALAECLNAGRVIVICPKPALERVWIDTIQQLYVHPQTYWDSGQVTSHRDQRFAIYHYEALDKALASVESLYHDKTCIILDESHNFSDLNAVRTQRFIQLCQQVKAKDVVLASGTPIKALSVEAIPIFRAIDPLFTDDVIPSFRKIFQGEANRATKILAERLNLVSHKIEKDELKLSKPIFQDIVIQMPDSDRYTLIALKSEMEKYASQRVQEFKKEYPQYRKVFDDCIQIAYVRYMSLITSSRMREAANVQHQEYLKTVDQIVQAHDKGTLMYMATEMAYCTRYEKEVLIPYLPDAEYRNKFKEAKSIVKYYKLKVRGECLGGILGRRRIEAHAAMARYIDYEAIINSTEKKTIFFSSFIEVIQAAEACLKELRYQSLGVYGKATRQLSQIVKEFEVNPLANPLLATYASLSTAVPLVMADTLVMINPPYRDYVLQQTVSRINRLGATTQTYCYTCILDTGTEPNISSRTVDILKWSQDQIEQILQIQSPYKLEEDPEMTELPALEELHIPDIQGLYQTDLVAASPTALMSKWHGW
ncbi:MAG: DEAD/DEAH box helicase family protein, partial [Methylococcaceae bacterium]